MQRIHGIPLPLAAVVFAAAASIPGPARADSLPPALREAVKGELPAGIPEVAREAPMFSGAGGEYRIYDGDLDGAPPVECLLTFREPGKPARAVLLGLDGGKVVRLAVKLPGGDAQEPPMVMLVPFTEGRSLVLVKDPKAGSVLLAWDGKGAETVWDSGKPRPGQTRWYELDDLDEDGVREIVTYQKSVVDAVMDDELDEPGAGAASEIVEPIAVMRFQDGRWKKAEDLLEGLR